MPIWLGLRVWKMAIEQKWPAVPPQLFTANGTQFGIITVLTTKGFKVKQKVALSNTALLNGQFRVIRVLSETQLKVGLVNPPQGAWFKGEDVTAWTLVGGAYIYAEEQDKAKLKPEDIIQAVYDQEPTVGLRNVLVDQFGDYFDSVVDINGIKRLAVDAAVSITGVTVNLDAFTKNPPDNAIAVGTEDGTKTGVKHALKVASNGLLQVQDPAADASLSSIDGKLIDLNTTPVKTIQVFTKPWDAITATYPTATQEVYQSRVGGVGGTVQQTATINYTDVSKNFLQNVSVV